MHGFEKGHVMDGGGRRIVFAVAAIVVMGVAVRGAHFAMDPPVWHDEAAAILNSLGKSYAELWGPRFVNATEPPLSLWIFKASSQLLGDEPWALRLPSMLANVAAFVLAVWWFRRVLTPVGLIAFALLAGFSDRLLFHGCEAKTYSFDFLIAVIFIRWMVMDDIGESSSRVTRGRLARACLISPLVFLSYPLVFMLASLGILEAASFVSRWRQPDDRSDRLRTALMLGLYAIVSGGFALALVRGPIREIQTASVESIWAIEFPHYHRPWYVPIQFVAKIFETFRYAQAPFGQILAIATVVGGVALARRGQRTLVAWFGIAFALNAAAWFAGKYPLGPYRVTTYLMPGIFLLSAEGIAVTFAALQHRRREKVALASVLIAIVVGLSIHRFVVPWKRLDSAAPTQYVLEQRRPDQPVVAMLWEQWYYLRSLGPMLRTASPPIDDPELTSFWFLGNHRDQGTEFLSEYTSSGRWIITHRETFRHFTVLCFTRRDVEVAVTPVSRGSSE